MATQTRMKQEWGAVARFIGSEWPRLTEADLAWIDGDYDRLFEAIGRYYRQVNIVEGERICGRIQKFLIGIENL